MTRSYRLILLAPVFLGLVCMMAGLAGGQQPPTPVVLNLQQVVDKAVSYSPEVAEAQNDVVSAKSDLAQAESAYYPQIETIAIAGPVRDAEEPLVVDGRITDPSPGLSFSSIGIFGKLDITATQPLYTFGKISNRQEAAAHGVKAKEHAITDRKGRIALRAKQLYYGLVLARAGLDYADESRDFFDEAAKRIRNLLDLGSTNVKESDLYQVDSYRAEATRFRAEAEKGMRTAYFALKSMMGMPAGVDFEPADRNLPLRPEGLRDLDHYVREARTNRPEFKQLSEALAAQEYMVKGAVSDRYPSFFAAAVGSFAGAPGRDHLNNPYISDDFNHAYGGIVAGAKWNLDFGITKAKIDKAKAEYNKLLNTKASAEMNIPIQVAKIYQDHVEASTAVNTYRDAAVATRKWVVTAMADFDMGVGTADDMLRAIERYGQNQGKYIEALFRYNLSLAELENAIGMKTW